MRYITTILMTMVLMSSAFGSWFSCSPEKTSLRELKLQGEITRNTAEFVMNFEIEISDEDKELELLVGDVACMDYKISDKKHQLTRTKAGYTLKFERSGKKEVSIRFATKVTTSGETRVTSFKTPAVALRNLTVNYPEKFNVKVKGSLKQDISPTTDQKSSLKTALPVGRDVEVSWVPTAVTAHSQETAASAEVIAVADVNVDTVLYNYLFKYKVIRNRLNHLSFEVPKSVVVTDISGDGVRDWLVSTENGQQVLKVYLNRFPTDRYQLKLTAEQRIKAVPSEFKLSVVRPLEMMRTSGYLELGAYSGIKMAPIEQLGITRAAPNVGILHEKLAVCKLPRTLYMFSRVPFEMSLHTEFIKTVMVVDYQTVINVDKDRVGVVAQAEVEVRDNPAREFLFTVPADYLVSQVKVVGHASDYRSEKVDGKQQVKVMLKQPVLGKVSVTLNLENDRLQGPVLATPKVVLENAYSHRGVLVFQTALGLNCEISATKGLRQVSLNSVSMRGQGLSSAWRYKVNDWEASFKVDQKPVSIYADSFHLYSLGESSTFGSTLINLHVAGAPIDNLKLMISPQLKNVEFTGRSIRKSSNDGNVWNLELSDKIFGDYTLLVRYDTPLNTQTNQYKYQFVEVTDAEHENGYMVLAGTEGIKIPNAEYDGQIVELPVGELPSEYGVLVNSTVLKCYRYSREKGESAALTFDAFRYKPTSMLSLIVDFTSALTQVSENGELVTTVTYRLKNASEQYFQLKMPEGAKLWSAKIEGKNIQLAQNDGALMVPLSKLRDPSKLINLQLIYAQKVTSLKERSELKLNLPLVKGQGTYAHWQVTVPDQYNFTSVNSNMELKNGGSRVNNQQNRGFISALKHSIKSLFNDKHLQLFVIVSSVMLFFMTLAVKLQKRSSKLVFSIAVFVAVILFTGFSQLSAFKVWMLGFKDVGNVINLTKSVNLGGEILALNANVSELQFCSSAPLFGGCLVGSFVILILAFVKKNYLLGGVAMAAFIVAANESSVLSLIAALLTICITVWFAIVIIVFLVSILLPKKKVTDSAVLFLLFTLNSSLCAKDLKDVSAKKVVPEYTVDQVDYKVAVVKGKSWAVMCKSTYFHVFTSFFLNFLRICFMNNTKSSRCYKRS